jgi:glutamate N-acetyltransferase/amino-acid N-acetyltransferase
MPKLKPSPLAPANQPEMPVVPGVWMSAVASGIRYSGRKDLLLMQFAQGTEVAGVFTRSLTAAAPVLRSKQHVQGGAARALVVNSGNANAFTGQMGEKAVTLTCAKAAELVGCEEEECYVASTGVIGEPLPTDKILEGLPIAHQALSDGGWQDAAEAIMTTDTFPKMATRKAKIAGVEVTLNGIAKGSGMIAPDMATMLGFIVTDANIPCEKLQAMLSEVNAHSFNAITVDSDTSTSDMVLLFATAQAEHAADADLSDFKAALASLMLDLAQQIVRDGEGAKKLFSVKVEGAADDNAARTVAMAVANSPLVKTAIAGEDANWGRVVMAVGKAGEKADRDKLTIRFGPHPVAEKGQRHGSYDEAVLSDYMKAQELEIGVDLGIGEGHFTAYSCDLTEGYIRINADYRS